VGGKNAATSNNKTHSAAGGKKSGKTIGVVVLILIVIGVAGGSAMFIHKKRQTSGPTYKKFPNYENRKGGVGAETPNPTFAGHTLVGRPGCHTVLGAVWVASWPRPAELRKPSAARSSPAASP
jgi:hypothetical protein